MIEEDVWTVIDTIAIIRREIGYSYPYSAGSVTINYEYYSEEVLRRILKHFLERQASIVFNPLKKQVKITDYLKG